MDRYKIHKAVEYIRSRSEFPFDGIDVEESLDEVLAYFGLHPQLDEDERQQLRQDLLPLAWGDEEAEMSRLAELSVPSCLEHVRDVPGRRRCTPQGVHSLFVHPAIMACTSGMSKGVSPFSGETAPMR